MMQAGLYCMFGKSTGPRTAPIAGHRDPPVTNLLRTVPPLLLAQVTQPVYPLTLVVLVSLRNSARKARQPFFILDCWNKR